MTRYKDLIAENHKLKKQIECLKKEKSSSTVKESFKIDNRFGVQVFGDGRYVVSSPIHYKDFRLWDKSELRYDLDDAKHQVKERYIKDALLWLTMDSSKTKFGGFNLLSDKNIPLDTIIVNPKVSIALQRSFNSKGLNQYEQLFVDILVEAEYV